jgi:hypothetical protein
VQHIGGEDIRNTEREAENNTQNTGPIVIRLEMTVVTKNSSAWRCSRRKSSHQRLESKRRYAALIDGRIGAGIETEGKDQVDN